MDLDWRILCPKTMGDTYGSPKTTAARPPGTRKDRSRTWIDQQEPQHLLVGWLALDREMVIRKKNNQLVVMADSEPSMGKTAVEPLSNRCRSVSCAAVSR